MISFTETVAVFCLVTTIPPAIFASSAAVSIEWPQANIAANVDMTVSPAPETSKTSLFFPFISVVLLFTTNIPFSLLFTTTVLNL